MNDLMTCNATVQSIDRHGLTTPLYTCDLHWLHLEMHHDPDGLYWRPDRDGNIIIRGA